MNMSKFLFALSSLSLSWLTSSPQPRAVLLVTAQQQGTTPPSLPRCVAGPSSSRLRTCQPDGLSRDAVTPLTPQSAAYFTAAGQELWFRHTTPSDVAARRVTWRLTSPSATRLAVVETVVYRKDEDVPLAYFRRRDDDNVQRWVVPPGPLPANTTLIFQVRVLDDFVMEPDEGEEEDTTAATTAEPDGGAPDDYYYYDDGYYEEPTREQYLLVRPSVEVEPLRDGTTTTTTSGLSDVCGDSNCRALCDVWGGVDLNRRAAGQAVGVCSGVNDDNTDSARCRCFCAQGIVGDTVGSVSCLENDNNGNSNNDNDNDVRVGAVVGSVLGALVLLLASCAAVALVLLCTARQRNGSAAADDAADKKEDNVSNGHDTTHKDLTEGGEDHARDEERGIPIPSSSSPSQQPQQLWNQLLTLPNADLQYTKVVGLTDGSVLVKRKFVLHDANHTTKRMKVLFPDTPTARHHGFHVTNKAKQQQPHEQEQQQQQRSEATETTESESEAEATPVREVPSILASANNNKKNNNKNITRDSSEPSGKQQQKQQQQHRVEQAASPNTKSKKAKKRLSTEQFVQELERRMAAEGSSSNSPAPSPGGRRPSLQKRAVGSSPKTTNRSTTASAAATVQPKQGQEETENEHLDMTYSSVKPQQQQQQQQQQQHHPDTPSQVGAQLAARVASSRRSAAVANNDFPRRVVGAQMTAERPDDSPSLQKKMSVMQEHNDHSHSSDGEIDNSSRRSSSENVTAQPTSMKTKKKSRSIRSEQRHQNEE